MSERGTVRLNYPCHLNVQRAFHFSSYAVYGESEEKNPQNTEFKVLTEQNTINEGCNFIVVSEIVINSSTTVLIIEE